MSDVILFDLYGVIARTQTEQARERLVELAGVPGERFWAAYWDCRPDYDAGLSSAAYWENVAARLGTTFADVPALTAADLESWSQSDPEMVALVNELADEGRTLGLLSNIIEDLVPVWERTDWLRRFAARTFSCRIGVAKPDPRAYEVAAGQLGVPMERILFLDDSEANVRAAREVGMGAEVFTSAAQVRKLVGAAPTW
ncbi:HAD family hydrolase [Nonomuraea sp. NPDC059007]|uniref:HAD family hydrolase n=1 Tax=Nonomuraea sp. NPDC059007 TaxID=3346692 RepID=UPI0036C5C35E